MTLILKTQKNLRNFIFFYCAPFPTLCLLFLICCSRKLSFLLIQLIRLLFFWHTKKISSSESLFHLKVVGPSSDWILSTIKSALLQEPRLNDKSSSIINFFSHYSFLAKRPFYLLTAKYNVLFFTHLDGFKYRPSWFYQITFLFYDAIICMNSSSLSYLQTLYPKPLSFCTPRLFLNFFAGVNSNLLKPPACISSSIQNSLIGYSVVGFHCRPYQRKRCRLIADAVLQIPDCILLCCGPGHDSLADYQALRNENRVIFLDLPFDQISYFYSLIDILACTSCLEGGPTPLMEANALGIPFISTDVGFASDVATCDDIIVPVNISAIELSSVIKSKLSVAPTKRPKVRMWADNASQFYEDFSEFFH